MAIESRFFMSAMEGLLLETSDLPIVDLSDKTSPPQNGPLCIVGRLGRGRNESARGTMGWGKRRSSRVFSLLIVARALAVFIEMPSWNLCGGESDKTKFGWRSSLVTQCIPTLHWADSALYCPDIFPDKTCIPKFLTRKTTRRRFPFQG